MSQIIFRFPEEREAFAKRFQTHKALFDRGVLTGIYSIFDDVALHKDDGIRKATSTYDQVVLDDVILPQDYIDESIASLTPALRAVIDQAIENVREVNKAMKPESWELEIRPGTVIGEKVNRWIP